MGVPVFFIIEKQAHLSFLLTFGINQMYFINFLLIVERSEKKQRPEQIASAGQSMVLVMPKLWV